LGKRHGRMYVSMWEERLEQLYYEQEGIIGVAVERIITKDNKMDSSDNSHASSDMSESERLSGVEELEKGLKDSCEEDKNNYYSLQC
jgi:hypothetical protein